VLLRPDPFANGGVVLNGKATDAYGNLFHIFAGNDPNMAVWDSKYDEMQLHFRVRERLDTYHMYRMGMSNTKMYYEYAGPNQYTGAVSASHTGYCNVIAWEPSTRTDGDFDATLSGSLHLDSSSAQIQLGNAVIRASDATNTMVFMSSNIGIGTGAPTSNIHMYTSNRAVLVTQGGVGNILEVASSNGVTVVGNQGNIGIGTRTPRAALDVQSGQVYVANGSVGSPSYSFAASPTSGLFSVTGGVSVATSGNERVRIDSTGNVMVGTQTAIGLFSVQETKTTPLVSFVQNGTGDVLRATGSNGQPVLTCTANGAMTVGGQINVAGSIIPAADGLYDLGSSNNRWRDIYVSAESVDIGGTRLSKTSNGDILVGVPFTSNVQTTIVKGTELKSLIVKQLNIDNSIFISASPSNTVTFTTMDTNTGEIISSFTPVIKDDTFQSISVGTDAKDATMHLVTPSNVAFPTMVLDQYYTCNIMELRSFDKSRFVIDYNGNVGIGSSLPSNGLVDVMASNTMALYVGQSNLTGSIAAFGNRSGQQVIIDSNGNVGIHTNPTVALDVVGQSRFDGWATFTSNVNMNANVTVQGNTITHGDAVTDSDRRLKTDLNRIENALDKVGKLTGYTFIRINDQQRSTGLVAQEVLEVLPEAVNKVSPVHYGVCYGNMVGLVVEAIKELHDEVKGIKERLGMI
jgi:hypothetical protein